MALIHTLRGDMDESELLKTEQVIDNDVERTTAVEYCVKDCAGAAHVMGVPQAEGCFCPHNVHRSVDMYLKRNVVADAIAAWLG